MKHTLLYVFFLLVFSCKEDEEFRPYAYDGAYPVRMDGSRIQTYTPEKHGGEFDVQFNGHTWNHAPYLALYASEMPPSVSVIGETQLSIGIHSLLTFGHIDPCIFENLSLRIPLKTGRYVFGKDIPESAEVNAHFSSINCDAGKDYYRPDPSKSSWVDVTRYDAGSRALEAEFNLSFLIKDKNLDFAPIYPQHVNLKGKIKTVAKLFE